MTLTKAIIFDFIGTLTSVRNHKSWYLEPSKLKLHTAIVKAGFDVGGQDFLNAYSKAHEKYRAIRYEELVEVTNAVWISEALSYLGFGTNPNDTNVKMAVNIFFEDYLNSLEINPCAEDMLREVSKSYRLGLVSNFTYAPVVHAGLRKLGIHQFFNAIVVSEDIGVRKPGRKIFEEALKRLGTTASGAIYVGDSPQEDIKGAASVGMRTIFVASQFYSLEDLIESQQKPDLVVGNICELRKRLPKFVFATPKPRALMGT